MLLNTIWDFKALRWTELNIETAKNYLQYLQQ